MPQAPAPRTPADLKREFREDEKRRTAWAKVLNTPIMQEVMELIRLDGPEFEGMPQRLSATDASIRLGHRSGFSAYQEELKLLAMRLPISRNHQPEETYEPPEE